MAELVYERAPYYYNPTIILARFVNAVIGIIEFFLLLRLLFEFLGANPSATFVAWLYSFTGVFVNPFHNAFPSLSIVGFPLDLSVLLAMVAYAILGMILVWFIDAVFSYV